MQSVFITISVIISLISPIIYVKEIVGGSARPHRTTRLVLLVTTILTTLSLIAQKDTVAVWLAGVATFQSITIFILSIKYGMGGWAKIDIISLLIALTGIVLWKITSSPQLALFFAVGADIIGMIPTLIKTYKLPKTESWLFFFLDTIGALFNLFAIQTWVLKDYVFPLYIFIINMIMVLLIVIPRKALKKLNL